MEQYISALDRFDEIVSQEALYQAVIGYHRVKDYFTEDSVIVAKSLIRCGEISQFLNNYDISEDYYQLVISNYPDQRKEAARAELKIVSLPHIPTDSRIQRCQRIIERYPEQEADVAEALINLGGLYNEIGESGQCLSA